MLDIITTTPPENTDLLVLKPANLSVSTEIKNHEYTTKKITWKNWEQTKIFSW
jgi:hypothetical protein